MLDELGISNEQLSGGSRRGAPLGDIRFVTIQYTGSRKGKRCPLITRAKTQCLPILYIIYPYAQILLRFGAAQPGDLGQWCLVLQIRMREKTHEHRNIVLNRYSIIYLM